MAPPPRPAEQQLAPGVYFTPSSHATSTLSAPTTPTATLSELERTREALVRSIAKLRTSNDDMRHYDPHHRDPELVSAISENCAIILTREAELSSLQERIRLLRGAASCATDVGAAREDGADGREDGMYL